MRVRAYYNLHRHLFSIVALEGPDKGRVIRYEKWMTLDDATFKVRQAGRKKVLMTGRKNVHAFVIGTISAKQDRWGPGWADVVGYNPYKFRTFVTKDTHVPVHSAKKVWLTENYLLALDINKK